MYIGLCGGPAGCGSRLQGLHGRWHLPCEGFDDGCAEKKFCARAGCPNGCARPYMAELGFVGDGPNSYQLWLGGSPNQTRLAEAFQDRVKLQARARGQPCVAHHRHALPCQLLQSLQEGAYMPACLIHYRWTSERRALERPCQLRDVEGGVFGTLPDVSKAIWAHWAEIMPPATLQDIEKVLEPLLFLYKQRRRPGEAFGDFCARQGFEALRTYGQVRAGFCCAAACPAVDSVHPLVQGKGLDLPDCMWCCMHERTSCRPSRACLLVRVQALVSTRYGMRGLCGTLSFSLC